MADIYEGYVDYLANIKLLFLSFIEDIDMELSKTPNLLSINKIEQYFIKLDNELKENYEIWIDNLFKGINEKFLIAKIREEYKNNNINLKTNRRAPITIQTLHQKLTINRYSLSPISKSDADNLLAREGVKNIVPVDIFLGIAALPIKMTVGAMLKVAEIAQGSSSFISASSRLRNDFGIKLDPKTIMSVTNHIGEIALQNEMNRADEIYARPRRVKLAFPEKKKEGVLYIQVESATVNIREEDESANSGREEIRLGIVYNSYSARASGEMTRRGIAAEGREIFVKDCVSYVGSLETFQKLLFACAIRNGYGEYARTALIGDGVDWIRDMKENLFPDARWILDFYRLRERVWDFGKLYFSGVIPAYTKWAKTTCEQLMKSESKTVVKDAIEKEKEKNIVTNKLSDYISNNIMNIDYAKYLEDGLDIDGDPIESANKIFLQRDVKRPGTRWNLSHARNMVFLRAKMESGKWFGDVVAPVKNFYNIKII
ncbi:MAG: hypothetical protein LBO66_10925 [Deltaproteobacteria bacterium]|jgi:hypothetical protein|nr:hypothetical protein [Deltaproteobacteria bacterium]